MKTVKTKLFKTKKEEKEWLINNHLTVGKLIKFLEKFDNDTLIYASENFGILCGLPNDPERLFKQVTKDKQKMKKTLENWYKKSFKTKEELNKKVKEELAEIYQYTTSKAIVLQL